MAKAVAKKPAGRHQALVKKKGKYAVEGVGPAGGAKTKIKVGFVCNKWHDPIPVGTQDRDYPEEHKCHNNLTSNPNANGWGGQFQVDVSMGLKVLRLHPDIFEVDFMKGSEVTPARIASNHINFNMWYDCMCALNSGDKKHINEVIKAQKAVNMWPTWEYANWIYHKIHYMKQLIKAGVPMIPTIFVEDGFNPSSVLTKVQAKGWDKFFVKPAYMGMFGMGAIHGKTKDFIADPSLLENFRKEAKDQKQFLVQPYMIQPNGMVFDEVRHYFIDGTWSYAIFTDGTDEDNVYHEPEGERKEKTKVLALKAFQEVLKVTKWCGESIVPTFTRIDVGLYADKANPKKVKKVFVNEVEMEMCTWLCRYCPFNLVDRMGPVYVKKARELLTGLLKAKKPLKDKAEMKKLLQVLEERCGRL